MKNRTNKVLWDLYLGYLNLPSGITSSGLLNPLLPKRHIENQPLFALPVFLHLEIHIPGQILRPNFSSFMSCCCLAPFYHPLSVNPLIIDICCNQSGNDHKNQLGNEPKNSVVNNLNDHIKNHISNYINDHIKYQNKINVELVNNPANNPNHNINPDIKDNIKTINYQNDFQT